MGRKKPKRKKKESSAKRKSRLTSQDNRSKQIAKNKQTISACMIVKNEEKFLPQCLNSIKDHVDEIIVVDTGSTDRTVAIAEEFGAKVYHHPWENDFSKHRNQSISYASGEWILIVDADEELDRESAPLVRKLVNEVRTAGITFNVRSYLDEATYYTEGSSLRLFKNGRGFHYRGYVHNQLIFRDRFTPSSIVLWHYGYDLMPDQLEAKQHRSMAILKRQLNEFPDDLPTRHHLAMTLLSCKKYDAAYEEAELTLKAMKSQGRHESYFSWTYFVAVTALMKLKRFDEAQSWAEEALKYFDWSIDIHYCLTQIKLIQQEHEEVLKHGQTFFKLGDELQKDISRFPVFQFETANRFWVIYRAMGYAKLYLGQHDEGQDLFEKAIDSAPNRELYRYAEEMGMAFLRLNEKGRAVRFLRRLPAEDQDFKEALLELGRIYEETEQNQQAVTLYGELEKYHENDERMPLGKGVNLLKLGRYKEAANAFDRALRLKPNYLEALINSGLCLEELGDIKEAEKKYRAALVVDHNSPVANLNLGLFLFKEESYLEAGDHLQRAFTHFSENVYLGLALSRVYLETWEIEAIIAPLENVLRSLGLPSDLMLESVTQMADLFVEIADKLFNDGRFEAFDLALKIAVLLRPEALDVLKGLGQMAVDLGEYQRAINILEAALQVDPSDGELQHFLSQMLDGLPKAAST
jgi:tetratricopeptide (TPR) repeat protein